MRSKQIVALVSFDIEGAFDNAWWPSIKEQLRSNRCPGNLYNVFNSYLSERSVTLRYAGAHSARHTNKGCIQGSIGGPLFWNILIKPLLRWAEGQSVQVQAFADDIVVVASDHDSTELNKKVNKVLDYIRD